MLLLLLCMLDFVLCCCLSVMQGEMFVTL